VKDEQWLTSDEVVARYRLTSKAALYAMRHRGTGPRGYRIGRVVMFKESELLAWEATRADPERTAR
jgi:predicted DNA-binding transcriptional regulator AlpA